MLASRAGLSAYVDTYCKVALAKLLGQITPISAFPPLPVLRILTDRGTEYCRVDKHGSSATKVKSPQTNGGNTGVLSDHIPRDLRCEALQADLDQWIDFYNTERTHQGKMCCGRKLRP